MNAESTPRIVIPTEQFWPEYTGWVKQTLKLACATEDRLHFVSVSRPSTAEAEAQAHADDLPSNVELRRRGPSLAIDGLAAQVGYILSAAVFVVRRRASFDVLYLPYVFFPAFLFILLGAVLRLPVAIRISGQEVSPNRSLAARLRFWSLQFVDAVVVLNETDRRRTRERGVADSRIRFIPNAVDVDHFRPKTGGIEPVSSAPVSEPSRSLSSGVRPLQRSEAEGETPLPDSNGGGPTATSVVIGFAGIICRRKGVRELLEAYDSARESCDAPLSLLLAGPTEDVGEVNSAFVQKVARTARTYGEGVQLLGTVSAMARFYRALDLFVLPSYREGMPNVLLEAMATGLPCVSTDIPGVREVITSGKNGLLVPPKDDGELADALSMLIQDPGQRKTLGRVARTTIVESFSIGVMADRYVDFFTSILEENNADCSA